MLYQCLQITKVRLKKIDVSMRIKKKVDLSRFYKVLLKRSNQASKRSFKFKKQKKSVRAQYACQK